MMEIGNGDPHGIAGADDFTRTCSDARSGARMGKGAADPLPHDPYRRRDGEPENDEQQNVLEYAVPFFSLPQSTQQHRDLS